MGFIGFSGKFTLESGFRKTLSPYMPLLLDSPQALDWLVGNEPERCGFELTKAPVYPAAPAHDGGEQLGLF